MPDADPPGWLKSWIATSLASTVYASVGVSAGAIFYLVAPRFGGQPWAWFFVGTCIPPGLMSLVNTSDWMFRRRLRNLKQLFAEGLISEELYEQDRKRAMDWRADRLYGRAPVSSSQPKPGTTKTKRTKAVVASQGTENPAAEALQPGGQPEATPQPEG
jgi:hypothetical protein